MMRKMKKWLPLILAVVIVASIATGTVAFLKKETDKVSNTFTKGEVGVDINEDFDGTVKENVNFTNDGSVYEQVRASITINWVDADGNICGQAPVAGVDYEISFGGDWSKDGGSFWYYYEGAIGPGETTTNLINSVKPLVEKEGYTLQVDIAAQAIQANAAADTWG